MSSPTYMPTSLPTYGTKTVVPSAGSKLEGDEPASNEGMDCGYFLEQCDPDGSACCDDQLSCLPSSREGGQFLCVQDIRLTTVSPEKEQSPVFEIAAALCGFLLLTLLAFVATRRKHGRHMSLCSDQSNEEQKEAQGSQQVMVRQAELEAHYGTEAVRPQGSIASAAQSTRHKLSYTYIKPERDMSYIYCDDSTTSSQRDRSSTLPISYSPPTFRELLEASKPVQLVRPPRPPRSRIAKLKQAITSNDLFNDASSLRTLSEGSQCDSMW